MKRSIFCGRKIFTIAMLLAAALVMVLLLSGTISLEDGRWIWLVPIVLCLGMHLLMHRGHGKHREDDDHEHSNRNKPFD
ncbi:DUF2933 domain-containing protein [Desulfurispirillum indicum]|uniref:DUF2933 domain-containing protein n=1 Tax=Desulfurispirillum indicum (strain ATCC BAA-1389 / DSM 22839 / S5) TaxID=653733 RepID=E6W4S3_DESIS|nr:DUF2933 domain-containing protein [Desulfurispirillum indicum]ADU64801.1 hypothetical protein Selin_0042 [Desulfurispirillum indicum S5]UCZ56733.1 DUF2933 domain-containing protein [Desulfurispirillum indicum]